MTTIQITPKLQQELTKRKLFDRETYEEIIWDLIEDTNELSEQALKDLEKAKKEVEQGKTVPLSKIKQKLGM